MVIKLGQSDSELARLTKPYTPAQINYVNYPFGGGKKGGLGGLEIIFFCLNYFLDLLPFSHAYKGDPDPLIFPHNYLIAFM